MPQIEVTDLRKSFAELPAVDGVTFSVHRGECLTLLGPNGAGKTTIVEILEGFLKADSGYIRVLGEQPFHGGLSWKSRIGIVPQSSSDLGDLSVIEATRHFASYFSQPRSVDEVISAVGLSDKSTARISRLSGGQRRRLDVALGIIGRPEVLFLDEPTTGFDPEARRQFWTLIQDLKSEGTTVLLTTHYLEEAEQLADRVAVLVNGQIVAYGAPSQIGGRPEESAVVSWLEGNLTQEVATQTPTAFILELRDRLGGEVPQLFVRRSTLEDVYLSLLSRGEQS